MKEIPRPEIHLCHEIGHHDILLDLRREIDSDNRGHNIAFPIDVFPLPIKQLIIDAEETIGFHPDYLSAGILSACATAIGKSVEFIASGHINPAIFWMAVIGRSGSGKSHPLAFAINPIRERDSRAYQEYEAEKKLYDEQMENKGRKPRFCSFVLQDFTIEKLADACKYNEKGILIFRDEMMGFIESFDRYNKGGDQETYLELYNGGTISTERKTSEPIRVDKTNVNILGGLQPAKLKRLGSNNRSDDGFLFRCLFVYPDKIEPREKPRLPLKEHHKMNYENMIARLMDAPSMRITACEECEEIFEKWRYEKDKEYHDDDLEHGIQAKIRTAVWRLVLVLEMMHQAAEGDFRTLLNPERVRDAIRLGEYFRENAFRVANGISNTDPLANIPAKQRDAIKELPEYFEIKVAIEIFKKYNVSPRTCKRVLSDKKLFNNYMTSRKLKRGEYQKKI